METRTFPHLNRKRYIAAVGSFFLVLTAVMAAAPLIGSTRIDLAKALSGGPGFAENVDANILFLIRLPRIFMAALAGAALAVSGAVFQAILRNDLAAPITLGVSGGASLGAVIAIRAGFNFTFMGFSSVPLASFLGALGALAIVFSFARMRGRELPTSYLLLAGVTVNFFFASMVMLVNYFSNITQSFQIVRWLMGGLDITDYKTLLTIAPPVFLGIAVLIYLARDLNLVSGGVESALARGVDVARVQLLGLLAASLVTGAVVANTGPIGFVGLIVPHIVRLIVGPDHRLLVPASVFFGASFLVLCDTAARTLLAPTEIPVGVITAILGGPFFFWLLRRKH
ncbi:MAG: iron ABC transporter permease [Nitrospinae bacterium]|nr:iron ABC transporter permease [Nitrospinota bacterium]